MDFQVRQALVQIIVLRQLTDIKEIMMFLQALPTQNWTEKEIELLLSEAFIWQSLFQNSSAHLRSSSTPASVPPVS